MKFEIIIKSSFSEYDSHNTLSLSNSWVFFNHKEHLKSNATIYESWNVVFNLPYCYTPKLVRKLSVIKVSSFK